MSSERRMVKRWEPLRDQTIEALVDWCHQRGLDPAVARVTGAHIQWEGPQTDEEFARAQEWEARRQERHEAWERETYERLRSVYGDSSAP